MIHKFNNNNMVRRVKNGFSTATCYKLSFKGTFSFAMDVPDFNSGQPSIKKTGRGSQSFDGAGASSSFSPYCKDRKEVMRQR